MPIWLRNFTLQKINEYHHQQDKAIEQAEKGKTVSKNSSNVIKRPTYSTKVKK